MSDENVRDRVARRGYVDFAEDFAELIELAQEEGRLEPFYYPPYPNEYNCRCQLIPLEPPKPAIVRIWGD